MENLFGISIVAAFALCIFIMMLLSNLARQVYANAKDLDVLRNNIHVEDVDVYDWIAARSPEFANACKVSYRYGPNGKLKDEYGTYPNYVISGEDAWQQALLLEDRLKKADTELNDMIFSLQIEMKVSKQVRKTLMNQVEDLITRMDDLRIKDGRPICEAVDEVHSKVIAMGVELEAEQEIINILVHMADVDEFNETARKHNPKYNDRTASLDR